MSLLNEADRVYLGSAMAAAVYAGAVQVWPSAGVGFEIFDAATAINVTVSGGGLVLVNTSSGTNNQGAHTVGVKLGGKHYYEATLSDWATGGSVGIGGIGLIGTAFFDQQNGATGGIMLQSAGGQIWKNYLVPGNIGERSDGDTIGFAVDHDNHVFWCRVVHPTVGSWNGVPTASPIDPPSGIPFPPGAYAAFCTFGGASTGPGNRVTTNFGSHSFLGAVPPGFSAGLTA